MTLDDLKLHHDRLLPLLPAGCTLHLMYQANYHRDPSFSIPNWEYRKEEWSAMLDGVRTADGIAVHVSGNGATPDAAVRAALADHASKRARVDAQELAKFREWRAARQRRGRELPADREGWDEAVSGKRKPVKSA